MNANDIPAKAAIFPSRPPMQPASGLRQIKLAPHQMADAVTATRDLFVLAHLGIPRVEPEHWSLTVGGLVGRAARFGYRDLTRFPKMIVEAAHQCCGNPLDPTVPTRRVANVRWGGTDLLALLNELGIDRRARFLWSYGLDGGEFAGRACDWYVKDLPLERLAAGGVLLAYELNGEPLPAEHGYPLRLVVPGYYGTNSVKWLWQLRLAEQRPDGLFTTELYNDTLPIEGRAADVPHRRPVWAIAPESIIVAPRPDAEVPLGKPVEIWGWAWSCRAVTGVVVTTDAGASFAPAALEPRRGWAWQRFSLSWRPSERGDAEIWARASDADGISQPTHGARNAVHRVKVTVT
jgi:sulfane dehydrogenase subunit SoxC